MSAILSLDEATVLSEIGDAIDAKCHPILYRGALRFVYVNSGALDESIAERFQLTPELTRDTINTLLGLGLVQRFSEAEDEKLRTGAIATTRFGTKYVESEHGMLFTPFNQTLSPATTRGMLGLLGNVQQTCEGTLDEAFAGKDYASLVEYMRVHDAPEGEPVRYWVDVRKRHQTYADEERFRVSVQVDRGIFKLPAVNQHKLLLRAKGFNDMITAAYNIERHGI
jgi:hypothetical protein